MLGPGTVPLQPWGWNCDPLIGYSAGPMTSVMDTRNVIFTPGGGCGLPMLTAKYNFTP